MNSNVSLAQKRRRSYGICAAVFLFPALFFLAVYLLYPIIATFFNSLHQWNGISADKKFIGLANWTKLAADSDFWRAFFNNIKIMVLSLVIQMPIGILLGIITAVKRGKWQDTVLTLTANVTASVPSFVIAVVLMWVFVIKMKLFSTSGFTLPWVDFGQSVKQGFLPIVCLSLGGIAGTCRQTRSSMLEAIRQDYVRTARSKGLKEGFIIYKHVMRNGLVPIITLVGGRLSSLIAGSAFVENVFGIPGMGNLLVNSVNNVDIPIMQATVMLTALVVSLAYLVTDFLYVVVDPRISLK